MKPKPRRPRATGRFTRDISRFISKVEIRADTFLRLLGLTMHRGVVARSPVLTGRFRGSHRLTVNRRDLTVAPEVSGNAKNTAVSGPPASAEMAAAEGVLASVEFGDTLYETNNLSYARELEAGKSRQAPDGVYGPTFEELKRTVTSALKSVS